MKKRLKINKQKLTKKIKIILHYLFYDEIFLGYQIAPLGLRTINRCH